MPSRRDLIRVTEDEAALREIGRSIVPRYFGVTQAHDVEPIVEATMKKRSAVRIEIERVVSWDHAKLDGRY